MSWLAWTPAELDVLCRNYWLIGGQGCVRLLPNRNYDAIRQKAAMLGLRSSLKRGPAQGTVYRRKSKEPAPLLALDMGRRVDRTARLGWQL